MERVRTTALPQVAATATRLREFFKDDVKYAADQLVDYEYYPLSGYSTMTDVVVDNFKKRSGRGEIFINPMTKYTEQVKEVPVNIESLRVSLLSKPNVVTHHSGQRTLPDDIPWLEAPVGVASWLESLEASALTSAFASNTTSKASALVSIGEGKETVTGVVDVFLRLMRIIRAVRNKQYKALRKELSPSEIADFWMEIRYGIRPIVFDLKQIVDAFTDDTKVGDRLTTRGYNRYSYSGDDSIEVPYILFDWNLDRTFSIEYNVRAGVLSQVERIGRMGTFGFADPIEAIYDLTTLSFVIDWFFNVGDTIAAHTPEGNLKTLGAWTVATAQTKQTVKLTGISNLTKLPGYLVTGNKVGDGFYERITTTVIRTPHTRASYLPRFNLNLNWAKMVDLCIIGRNIMKTIKSRNVRISRHGRLKVL